MDRNRPDERDPDEVAHSVFDDDELDDAVTAADDTGLISGERVITQAELEEAELREGNM
jgi:hypothetical protein